MTTRPVSPVPLPGWWTPLASRAAAVRGEGITRFRPPPEGGRDSAVLVLLGEDAPDSSGTAVVPGPDVLLLERAASLRNHAGQPAFPGGASEPGDADPAATALREATEEVALRPDTVEVVTTLPRLWIPVSGYAVTPVLGWWREPHEVYPADEAEVARVARLPVSELVDPANRLRVRHPSGYVGPAFQVREMLVWGFTAGVLSTVLDLAGWVRPWDRTRVEPLPPDVVAAADRVPETGDGATTS